MIYRLSIKNQRKNQYAACWIIREDNCKIKESRVASRYEALPRNQEPKPICPYFKNLAPGG
jgi:hypothetical protein